MVATLQASVKKMNDLLARLDRGGGNVEPEPARRVVLAETLAPVVAVKRRVHPVELTGDREVCALADAGRLRQAVEHLIQNAIDASAPGAPVYVAVGARGAEAMVNIVDSGAGMSADFIRTRLFQPFASTKDGGFGVGAYEARTLVAAMGGRIEVESREGEGSRFTVFLPLAATRGVSLPERMCA
jgi:signal transduction histidine kinase